MKEHDHPAPPEAVSELEDPSGTAHAKVVLGVLEGFCSCVTQRWMVDDVLELPTKLVIRRLHWDPRSQRVYAVAEDDAIRKRLKMRKLGEQRSELKVHEQPDEAQEGQQKAGEVMPAVLASDALARLMRCCGLPLVSACV